VGKTRELTQSRIGLAGIPALRKQEGDWAIEAADKADLLAQTQNKKANLPQPEVNEYTALQNPDDELQNEHMELDSIDQAQEVLITLKPDSATGPDKLPARVLQACAEELDEPIQRLARTILETGKWPKFWCTHLVPIHKRKSPANPENYREVHLTAQLSKVMERLLGRMFVPQAISIGQFGPNQFAYAPKCGARDAIAFMVLTWIRALNERKRIGLFCSDVSGAFDKVRTSRLIDKMRAAGTPQCMVKIIESWLQPRSAHVVVGGEKSDEMSLRDMVYQGTVWGPALWNMFFADARTAVRKQEFTETVYADDLNAFRIFDAHTTDEEIFDKCRDCQTELHRWGRANQVDLEPTNESMHILAHARPSGINCKILGVQFDCELNMMNAIEDTAQQASVKLATLMRTTKYYEARQLMDMYKSHVLSFFEYRTPAIYHASTTALDAIDRIQKRFLRHIGIFDEDAVQHFNLAPLACRRDMAMLGLIHRAILKEGPAHFEHFFFRNDTARRYERRHHSNELHSWRKGQFLELFRRSAFGLVDVYNMLPQSFMGQATVKGFQHELQALIRKGAAARHPRWHELFSPRLALAGHPLLRI